MEKEELKKLFKKYHEGTCTEEEKALLEAWYLQYNEQETGLKSRKIKAIGKRIFRELPGNHNTFINASIKLAIAAITIGLLITGTIKYFFAHPVNPASYIADISPGTSKAVLTLSNGKKINLSNTSNGQLAVQSGISIVKANGQVIYKAGGAAENQLIPSSNNITTPNGGQWQLTLPDGTKVWLNSASSLTYPASFSGQKERIVQLGGEAYFEVAKDKIHPFIVKSDRQEVRVLGTHFNINSYKDEPTINTTLLEGRVKVTDVSTKTIKVLEPGRQSILSDKAFTVSVANTEEALAWKNGYFRFNDENIQSIMRQLSRWYNVDVAYSGAISTEGLNGKVSRSKNISQVLKALEATKTVHFKVEGRRVIVMK